MPRYFFDVIGSVFVRDLKGTEFPDDASAQAYAEGLIGTLPAPCPGAQAARVVISKSPSTQADGAITISKFHNETSRIQTRRI